jgi:hypothetical protein
MYDIEWGLRPPCFMYGDCTRAQVLARVCLRGVDFSGCVPSCMQITYPSERLGVAFSAPKHSPAPAPLSPLFASTTLPHPETFLWAYYWGADGIQCKLYLSESRIERNKLWSSWLWHRAVVFRGTCSLHFRGWPKEWKLSVSLKLWYLRTRLHGVTIQETTLKCGQYITSIGKERGCYVDLRMNLEKF